MIRSFLLVALLAAPALAADSYNELFGLGSHSEDSRAAAWYPLQDDAASTAVDDQWSGGNNGTLSGDTTADLATTGPNSWLASAFDFGAVTNRYVDLGAASRSFISGGAEGTVLMRVKTSQTGRIVPVGSYGGTVAAKASLSIDINRGSSIPQSGAVFLFARRSGTGTDISGYATSTGINDGSWHNLSVGFKADTNTLTARIDKTDLTETYTAQTHGSTLASLYRNQYIGALNNDGTAGTYYADEICDVVFLAGAVTSAERDQWEDGPELNYTSGATFSGAGAYNVGAWALPAPFASGSNGTPTYVVSAVNAAGDVLGSDTTASGTIDISSEEGNTVYLVVRVSNTGGYDIGDKATRTSSFGSSGDGYYEIASVTAGGGGGGPTVPVLMHHYKGLR